MFRTKHDLDNQVSALETARGLLHPNVVKFGPKNRERLKQDHNITLRKFFACRVQSRRSADGTRANLSSGIALTICRREVEVVPPKRNRGQKLIFVLFFGDFESS